MDAGRTVPDILVKQITDDSRAVRPGALFVAVKGTKMDGHRFVDQAVKQGAAAVLLEEEITVPAPAVKLRVKRTQPILGPLAHAFFGSPSQRLKVVGITGTNGKTTVAWLTQHLLQSIGLPCGLIGTICYRVGTSERSSTNTTPGAIALQEMLAEMKNQGLKACAMEVSSHALDQHRTDGIHWAAGVFTNLSPEHLDYHQTVDQYLHAKLRLFEMLSPQAAAVINRESPVWERVRAVTRGRVVTYGFREPADVAAEEIRCSMEGTSCRLRTPEGKFSVRWNLVGRHNVENLLAALGAVSGLGIPLKEIIPGVERFPGVPGRLERIEAGQSFPVFVDYAHTDGALRSVLEQLRAVTTRKILVVFGCGGDRDRTKRPRMGRVAAELAHRVIVTSDNPRSEDPAAIADEVVAGIPKSFKQWEILLDRREAIKAALESADENWLVLIAGKGHETGQILKDQVIPFDDRQIVLESLRAKRSNPVFKSEIATAPSGPRDDDAR